MSRTIGRSQAATIGGAPSTAVFAGRSADRGGGWNPLRAWRGFRERHPIFCFIGGVIVLMAAFYAVYMPTWNWGPLERLLTWNLAKHARWSGGALKLLGEDTTVTGTLVSSPRFDMQIVRGCDALEPAALFLAAVIAFPVSFRKKLIGALLGIVLIEATNVVRMVSLYFVGVHWRQHFKMMHEEVWQAGFIVISVSFWALWALWASRNMQPRLSTHDVRSKS